MGLIDTIKGWFNIGGVTVWVLDVDSEISKKATELTGKASVFSSREKQILMLRHRFVMVRTTGSGNDKRETETVLGETIQDEPFELKDPPSREVEFKIEFEIPERLAERGGVLGAVGKLGAAASNEKVSYYVETLCDVKGTAFDPKRRFYVSVVD